MPWTDITRTEHSRKFVRYPSDLTDAEWSVIKPLVPPCRPGGRPRTADMREVLNAIVYVASGGIPWRMLPKDFPPVSTVRGYFYRWRSDGTLALMNYAPDLILHQGPVAVEVDLNAVEIRCTHCFTSHDGGVFWGPKAGQAFEIKSVNFNLHLDRNRYQRRPFVPHPHASYLHRIP